MRILLFALVCFTAFGCRLPSNSPDISEVSTPLYQVGESVDQIDNSIWSIYHDRNGIHWYGSNGSGIYISDQKTIRNYSTVHGLIHDQIRGIQGDHLGNVYIETPVGVMKFDGSQFITLKYAESDSTEWVLNDTDLWFNCNATARDIYDMTEGFFMNLNCHVKISWGHLGSIYSKKKDKSHMQYSEWIKM